jgi:hypothetical protein
VHAAKVGKGIAAQVGLAKRVSPNRASRFAQAAAILTTELPRTFAELAGGRTSEWRATIVARETAWLSLEHRSDVDRQIAPRLQSLGDLAVERAVKALAYRLDPHGYVERLEEAAQDRRVGLRPAPEAMTRLSGLLPVAQGVAAYATLGRDADSLIAAGDGRSRGQLMADLLVERVTGQSRATDVPVEIGLIMTDRALLQDGPEPAVIEGYGPVPAATARHLVTRVADEVPIRLRQLYTHPDTGDLIAMSSGRRHFPPALRRFVAYRDQYCRTPWCGAPIRHTDHVVSAARGGPTTSGNGQGLCVACNQAKEAPGWTSRAITAGARHTVENRHPDRPPLSQPASRSTAASAARTNSAEDPAPPERAPARCAPFEKHGRPFRRTRRAGAACRQGRAR